MTLDPNLDSFEDVFRYIERAVSKHNADLYTLAHTLGLDPSEDFKGANLSGIDFRGQRLSGFNLERTILVNCDFRETDIRPSQLKGAEIGGAMFDFRPESIATSYIQPVPYEEMISWIRKDPGFLNLEYGKQISCLNRYAEHKIFFLEVDGFPIYAEDIDKIESIYERLMPTESRIDGGLLRAVLHHRGPLSLSDIALLSRQLWLVVNADGSEEMKKDLKMRLNEKGQFVELGLIPSWFRGDADIIYHALSHPGSTHPLDKLARGLDSADMGANVPADVREARARSLFSFIQEEIQRYSGRAASTARHEDGLFYRSVTYATSRLVTDVFVNADILHFTDKDMSLFSPPYSSEWHGEFEALSPAGGNIIIFSDAI